jgi:hypothetical protein
MCQIETIHKPASGWSEDTPSEGLRIWRDRVGRRFLSCHAEGVYGCSFGSDETNCGAGADSSGRVAAPDRLEAYAVDSGSSQARRQPDLQTTLRCCGKIFSIVNHARYPPVAAFFVWARPRPFPESTKKKVAPLSTSLFAQISPPCFLTMR